MVIEIVLFSAVYLFFVIVDIFPMLHEKQWKELCIFSILFSSSFVIYMLTAMDFRIPSPATPIKKLVQFIFGLHSQ